jgi:LPXTG-motif cell wall-anchored protein
MGLDRNNWAIIVLGVCILMAAIFYSKKKSTDVKIKDEDILNELGYELEGGKGGPEAPKK